MALESNLCPPYLASLDFRRRERRSERKKAKKRKEEGEGRKESEGGKEGKEGRRVKRKRGRAENCGKGSEEREENRADQNGGQFVSAQVNEPIHRNGYSSFR